MSKFLDQNGLLYLWNKVKTYVAEHKDGGEAGSVAWENVTGKPQVALKSDLASIYRYKGSVASFDALPTEGSETGDVWNAEDTGMNYAWDGEKWDALGQVFEVQAITNAEIDAITAEG